MAAGDNKLVRVRGGAKGFRMITLGDWKDELSARRGKLKPKVIPRNKSRMEAKMKRRSKNRGKKS